MPRYFFHIRQGDELFTDDEGEELADLNAVRNEAVESARELMADDVAQGRPSELRVFEVTDEHGNTVLTLPFEDAIHSGSVH